jgi:Arabinose-binding domain of AraC transcription regulator, N-term
MIKHFRVAGMLGTRLDELGIPVSVVLRRAGLPQDLFKQTRILVSTPELFALWRAIAEVSKDSSIGLKLGTETKMERFHPDGPCRSLNGDVGRGYHAHGALQEALCAGGDSPRAH